jgi:hypothetical protein
MIKGDYEKLVGIVDRNLCAEHKAPLEVAWNAELNCHVIRCGKDHYPDAVVRIPSLTEELKQGANVPSPIKENIEKSMAKRAGVAEQYGLEGLEALLPARDLVTGRDLTSEVRALLVEFARKYDLDPYRGHVVLMYGQPYIGIDGYLYHANQTHRAYTLRSRPLNDEERRQFKIADSDHAWIAEVSTLDKNEYFMGIGVVTLDELSEEAKGKPGVLRYPVVARHPWLMAQKRAEWQALRRAFPIGETEVKSNAA